LYTHCTHREYNQDGTGSILILLASSQRTYMTSETCRVLFQKNKFEKLVHLVGFIIRFFHEARSPERQFCQTDLVHMRRKGLKSSTGYFVEGTA